jgi:hypothetical protein
MTGQQSERKMSEKLDNQIEALIDSHGLYGVVAAINRICHAKAEHLSTNWQDMRAAKSWDKAGTKFDKLWSDLRKIQEASF